MIDVLLVCFITFSFLARASARAKILVQADACLTAARLEPRREHSYDASNIAFSR